jgi:hypothetical protein
VTEKVRTADPSPDPLRDAECRRIYVCMSTAFTPGDRVSSTSGMTGTVVAVVSKSTDLVLRTWVRVRWDRFRNISDELPSRLTRIANVNTSAR